MTAEGAFLCGPAGLQAFHLLWANIPPYSAGGISQSPPCRDVSLALFFYIAFVCFVILRRWRQPKRFPPSCFASSFFTSRISVFLLFCAGGVSQGVSCRVVWPAFFLRYGFLFLIRCGKGAQTERKNCAKDAQKTAYLSRISQKYLYSVGKISLFVEINQILSILSVTQFISHILRGNFKACGRSLGCAQFIAHYFPHALYSML